MASIPGQTWTNGFQAVQTFKVWFVTQLKLQSGLHNIEATGLQSAWHSGCGDYVLESLWTY